MPRRPRTRQPIKVESITHDEASRRNLPSAEHQPLMVGKLYSRRTLLPELWSAIC